MLGSTTVSTSLPGALTAALPGVLPAATGPAAGAAPTGAATLAWLMVAAPLVSAGVLLLLGRRTDRWGHWLGVLAPVVSFVVGLAVLLQLIGLPADQRVIDQRLFSWI